SGGFAEQDLAAQRRKLAGFGAGLKGGAFEALDDGTEKLNLAGGAFQTLTSGLSAAVDAAISSSDNIGKAFFKASAAALKAIATESAVRAIYETAMGIGASIFSPGDAAKHFAAAGTFAAAAAAAGAGSVLLGGLGGGGSGGGTPSTPAGGGFASSP